MQSVVRHIVSGPPTKLPELALRPLYLRLKEMAEAEPVSRVCPSDVTIKQALLDRTTIQGKLFRNLLQKVSRNGKTAMCLPEEMCQAIYDSFLLTHGVHTGCGTIFKDYRSCGMLSKEISGSRGGRLMTKLKGFAEHVYSKALKSEISHLRFQIEGRSYDIHVVPPDYFVSNRDSQNSTLPDLFLGQQIKTNGQPSMPALQLSPVMQRLVQHWLGLEPEQLNGIKVFQVLND